MHMKVYTALKIKKKNKKKLSVWVISGTVGLILTWFSYNDNIRSILDYFHKTNNLQQRQINLIWHCYKRNDNGPNRLPSGDTCLQVCPRFHKKNHKFQCVLTWNSSTRWTMHLIVNMSRCNCIEFQITCVGVVPDVTSRHVRTEVSHKHHA